MPGELVLLRHGQSAWNLENRFTGWTDIDLTEQGRAEARAAGRALRRDGHQFDLAFTSMLTRAIRTAWIVMDALDRLWLPLACDWRLNERHYGDLQGLNKAETAQRFGEHQVQLWRRSFSEPPPPLDPADPRAPSHDTRYAGVPPAALPLGESLRDTAERVMPCWTSRILPELQAGRRVLVVAHGNSLRALVKHLDKIADTEIGDLEIATGVPLLYRLESDGTPVQRHLLNI